MDFNYDEYFENLNLPDESNFELFLDYPNRDEFDYSEENDCADATKEKYSTKADTHSNASSHEVETAPSNFAHLKKGRPVKDMQPIEENGFVYRAEDNLEEYKKARK